MGKVPLRLNLDETSVPVVFTGGKGNIMVHKGAKAWRRMMPRQRASQAEKRTFLTHVGIICDDPAVQPLLPQVIFVRTGSISIALWAALAATLPSNVYVKRMPRAWNNAQQHCLIIRILGLILEPFTATRQIILSFDAAGMHVHNDVLNEMAAAHFWYLLIPARLTWLLQPLDTHAFSRYKAWLRTRFQDHMCAGGDIAHMTSNMIRLVVACTRSVLQGHNWTFAFAQDGLTGDLSQVSSYIREQLRWDVIPHMPSTRPTIAELTLVWPRNRVLHPVTAFKPFPPLVAGVDAAPPVAAPPAPVPPAVPPPEFYHLGPVHGLKRMRAKGPAGG